MTAEEVKRIKARHYYDTVYREKKKLAVLAWRTKNKDKVKEINRRYREKQSTKNSSI